MISEGEMCVRLLLAAFYGSLIGFQREHHFWTAGLRTHMLVSTGACLFMIVSAFGFQQALTMPGTQLDPSRIAAQVVTGIGFLGAGSILVMKNCGPKGYPGMAEVGNMGLPAKLLAQGVTDMVRISDARMSGTAYGTVVLHVAPEAAAGGPLAAVQEGDWIELDCASGRLHLDIPDAELAARLADIQPPQKLLVGGYRQLYIDHVMQADQGCDFDFLVGCRGAEVPRHSH